MNPKLVIVLSRIPFPLEKGDKLRAFHQIKELAKTFEIYLYALHSEEINSTAYAELSKYCSKVTFLNLSKWSIFKNILLALFNGNPIQVGYFFNQKHYDFLQNEIDLIKPEYLYCQLIRTAEYIRKNNISSTIDYMDALGLGMKRRAKCSGFISKFIFSFESQRLQRYEKAIFNDFDGHTIISEADLYEMNLPLKQKVILVKNGVDFDFFQPTFIEKDFEIVFTGNMNYAPNVLAAIFLAKEILPLVQVRFPKARLLIAGADPHSSIKNCISKSVVVSGWVNDIRDSYARSKVFVAPMQIGTGLQNKLLEAMAMKIPCVCSDLANNALQAKPSSDILIASTPHEYANQIIFLLENPDKAIDLADNAYRFVSENYSWSSSTHELTKLILSNKKLLS